MNQGVAYASCGHAFHPICLLEYEKHAGHRSADSPTKCPLCRQPYHVKHFIPDDNLRSLCLEHTLHEAIIIAEAASKEADEKAKEAGHARSQASQAAGHAVRLRQQAGPAFCSSAMAARLASLQQTVSGTIRAAPSLADAASAGPLVVAGSMLPGTVRLAGRGSSPFMAGSSVVRQSSMTTSLPAAHRLHGSPAANMAAAVAAPVVAADPGPGFDIGVHVPLHEQIAMMRISSNAETLQVASQHPEVVLGIEEPEH